MYSDSLPRPYNVTETRDNGSRTLRSPTRTMPTRYGDITDSRYKLLKPCPDVTDAAKKTMTTTIFSPASASTSVAETMASPESRTAVSTTTTSPTSNNIISNEKTKSYSPKIDNSRSFISLINHQANDGQPPHANTYEALLNYVYTSDPGELIDLLNKSTENIFGLLQNIHYLNVEGSEKIYLIVANNITSSDKLKILILDDHWCEGVVPGLFLKSLILEVRNVENISQLDILKSVLYWARADKHIISSEGYICKDGTKLNDLLECFDFSTFIKEEVLGLLDSMVPDNNSKGPILSDENASKVIQKLFHQELPRHGRKTRRFTTALKSFVGKLKGKKKENTNFDLERQ